MKGNDLGLLLLTTKSYLFETRLSRSIFAGHMGNLAKHKSLAIHKKEWFVSQRIIYVTVRMIGATLFKQPAQARVNFIPFGTVTIAPAYNDRKTQK